VLLQIHRDRLKPGAEAAFMAIEEEAARACRSLNCPNPHVAIEAISAPRVGGDPGMTIDASARPAGGEVWWLNAFDSDDEKQRVYDAYASNGPLMAALADVGTRRHDVMASEVDVFATYRADLSGGTGWRVAGARFFVVLVTDRESPAEGVVFETSDGTRYIFKATRTREEADAIATHGEAGTTIFAVRPQWGKPAQEWIDADPGFWKVPC
jgi:hypothetical protein